MAAHYDVLATLVDLVKAPPVPSDGISFLPTLLGNSKAQKKHEYLYWEYPEKNGQLAIRMGKWKGVKVEVKKNPQARWELYDLEKDESETTSVAGWHPDLIRQFDAIVQREHTPSHLNERGIIYPKLSRGGSDLTYQPHFYQSQAYRARYMLVPVRIDYD